MQRTKPLSISTARVGGKTGLCAEWWQIPTGFDRPKILMYSIVCLATEVHFVMLHLPLVGQTEHQQGQQTGAEWVSCWGSSVSPWLPALTDPK